MSDHRAAAGRALGHLLADGSSANLQGRDLAIATSARDSVLGSCDELLSAVTGRRNRLVKPSIGDLVQRPLTHLSLGLANHPRLRVEAPSPTDLALDPSSAGAAPHWAAAADHLLIATGEFAQPFAHHATPEAAWACVADVAALARAVDRLDRDLGRAHLRDGNPQRADMLNRAEILGLGLVATAALEQAMAGAVDFEWRPQVADMSVRPVSSTETIPDDLGHLTQLLRHSPVLRPADVAQLALGQHYLAQTAANTLGGTAPEVTTRLRALSRTLAGVSEGHPDVASILPGDRRPVVQLGNIMRSARQLPAGHQAGAADRDIALAIARQMPDFLLMLHSKAVTEATRGRWITPDHEQLKPTWRKTTSFTPLRLTDITARASHQSGSLIKLLGPPPARPRSTVPALSAVVALAGRTTTPERPEFPLASAAVKTSSNGHLGAWPIRRRQ